MMFCFSLYFVVIFVSFFVSTFNCFLFCLFLISVLFCFGFCLVLSWFGFCFVCILLVFLSLFYSCCCCCCSFVVFFCLFFVVFGRTKVLSVQIISELVIAVFRFLSGSKFNLLGLLMALKTYQPSF